LREKRWQPALLNVIAASAVDASKQWGFVRANARAAKLSILIITQAAGIPVDAIANLIHMTTERHVTGEIRALARSLSPLYQQKH
jgi:hypothetical protein